MGRFSRSFRGLAMVLALVGLFALVSVAPAAAGTGPKSPKFIVPANSQWSGNTTKNGVRVEAWADSGGGTAIYWPPFRGGESNTWGGYRNAFNLYNKITRVDFGTTPYGYNWPSFPMSSAGHKDKFWVQFNVVGPVRVHAKARYLQVPSPPYHHLTGPIAVGSTLTFPTYVYMSPPAIYNPATDVDSDTGDIVANTQAMVVRNVKFTTSPTLLPDDLTSFEGPAFEALFTASVDTTRPGPITLAPGESYSFSLPPSMGDPTAPGRVMLMRFEIEDSEGNPQPMIMELADTPGTPPPAPTPEPTTTSTPARSWWGFLVLFAAGIALAFSRKRLPAAS